ncbi:hypothetical protein ACPA9J_02835 [Pseudomonas aeruginosa]
MGARRWAWELPRCGRRESSPGRSHVGAEVHRGQPLLSAELPETGERFEHLAAGSAGADFRAAQARHRLPLERYVIDRMMTSAQAGFLVRAVREQRTS